MLMKCSWQYINKYNNLLYTFPCVIAETLGRWIIIASRATIKSIRN